MPLLCAQLMVFSLCIIRWNAALDQMMHRVPRLGLPFLQGHSSKGIPFTPQLLDQVSASAVLVSEERASRID
jgi:hypothetical protein